MEFRNYRPKWNEFGQDSCELITTSQAGGGDQLRMDRDSGLCESTGVLVFGRGEKGKHWAAMEIERRLYTDVRQVTATGPGNSESLCANAPI
jgi:hypothetical protein